MDKVFFLLNERKKASKLFKLISQSADYEVQQNDPPILVTLGFPPAKVVFKNGNFSEQCLFIVSNLSTSNAPCVININGVSDVLKLRSGTIAFILASSSEIKYIRGFWNMFAGQNSYDNISLGYGATNTAGGIAIGVNASSTNIYSEIAIGHNVTGYSNTIALGYNPKATEINRLAARIHEVHFSGTGRSINSTDWTRLNDMSYGNSLFPLTNNSAYTLILTSHIRKDDYQNVLIVQQIYLAYYNSGLTPKNYLLKTQDNRITIGTVPSEVDLKIDFHADGQLGFYGKTDGTTWIFRLQQCLCLGGP